MKKCIKCNRWKSLDNFYNQRTKDDKKDSYCKECREEYQKWRDTYMDSPHYIAQSKRNLAEIAREYNAAHPIKWGGEVSRVSNWDRVVDNLRLWSVGTGVRK